jgi:tetraacyldisaccharide 4'-kinase
MVGEFASHEIVALVEMFHEIIRGERRGVLPALARLGLRALSVLYGLGVRLRNWCYDRGYRHSERALVPVVSVGNLTVGGTGKTPCVEYVARFLRSHERRVAILSRGYGAAAGPNDEALVLEENLPDVPHLQGADRLELARTAVAELESEVLVLDDGFQHRRLARDLDVVLIDATCPWGHGAMLPRGLLREPPRSLKRAQVVMLTRCDLAPSETVAALHGEVRRWAPHADIVETTHRPAAWINAAGRPAPLDELSRRPAAAFCGLGNPEAFRRTLERLGMTIVAWRTFPDHHGYSREDIESLRAWATTLAEDTVVITTQKDLVKIRLERLADKELWALQIRLHVDSGEEKLHGRLLSLIR